MGAISGDEHPLLGVQRRKLANAMTSPEPPYPAQESEEPTFSAWLLVWTIIAAKAGTLILILWAAHDFETGILLAATSWLWVPLIVAICASPVLFRLRLRRVRAKRDALKRAEWMVEETAPIPATNPHPAFGHPLPEAQGEGTNTTDSPRPSERWAPPGHGWG